MTKITAGYRNVVDWTRIQLTDEAIQEIVEFNYLGNKIVSRRSNIRKMYDQNKSSQEFIEYIVNRSSLLTSKQ